MIGTVGIENYNGDIEYFAVRTVIMERDNLDPLFVSSEIFGKLKAVNTKKVDPSDRKVVTNSNVARRYAGVYSYSIAHFIRRCQE